MNRDCRCFHPGCRRPQADSASPASMRATTTALALGSNGTCDAVDVFLAYAQARARRGALSQPAEHDLLRVLAG